MKQNKKRFLALILALTVATICVSFPAHAGEAEAAEVSDTQLLNADITTPVILCGSSRKRQECQRCSSGGRLMKNKSETAW